MYPKTITFKDLEDNDVTRTFYFNISKPELIKMRYQGKSLFDNKLKKIADEQDVEGMLDAIEYFIMKSYGEKDDDGISFVKTRNGESLAEKFKNTNAYDVLFEEFITDPKNILLFIAGIMPKDMGDQMMNNINSRGGIDALMTEAENKLRNGGNVNALISEVK